VSPGSKKVSGFPSPVFLRLEYAEVASHAKGRLTFKLVHLMLAFVGKKLPMGPNSC